MNQLFAKASVPGVVIVPLLKVTVTAPGSSEGVAVALLYAKTIALLVPSVISLVDPASPPVAEVGK